jgi:hypothetical protein
VRSARSFPRVVMSSSAVSGGTPKCAVSYRAWVVSAAGMGKTS